MAVSTGNEFNRPLTLALAAVAVCQLAAGRYLWSQNSDLHTRLDDGLKRAEVAARAIAAGSLQNLQKSAGTAADLKKQADDAQKALTEAASRAGLGAERTLAELTKQVNEAETAVSGAQEEASQSAGPRGGRSEAETGSRSADGIASLDFGTRRPSRRRRRPRSPTCRIRPKRLRTPPRQDAAGAGSDRANRPAEPGKACQTPLRRPRRSRAGSKTALADLQAKPRPRKTPTPRPNAAGTGAGDARGCSRPRRLRTPPPRPRRSRSRRRRRSPICRRSDQSG